MISTETFTSGSFKVAFSWIALIVGIICLCLGFFLDFNQDSAWEYLLIKSGEILIVSVLFSFLTTCAEYIGVFKKAIESIILLDGKYLKTKTIKDIERVWTDASKIIFKYRFSSISGELFKLIKDKYIYDKGVSYYSNCKHIIKITWFDEKHDLIKVTESDKWIIHSQNKDEFTFDVKYMTDVDGLSENSCTMEIKSLTIDGENVETIINETKEGNTLKVQHDIKLKGKEEYVYKIEYEKIYSVKTDFWIGYKARYMVNNLNVRIHLPPEIKASFISRGTVNNFECEDQDKENNVLEYSYNGLILRNQGYVIALNPE